MEGHTMSGLSDLFIPHISSDQDDKHSLGISTIEFKLSSHDEDGVLILENIFHAKGGPAKHLHYSQDEWFYCLEGKFRFEIGSESFLLNSGDSLLGPKMIPHVWAFIGEGIGRILVMFKPAGKMENFFREVTKTNAMPIQDPELWQKHGMKLLGPPISLT
jgi:quercetin dioxygenase-like cupin family protein